MESSETKGRTKSVLFLIGCVFAIVGGLALLINSFTEDTNGVRTESSNYADDGIPFTPFNPNYPETFNDPASRVVEVNIQAGNFNRRFNVFIPGAYTRTNADVPLVYVWHGFTQSPEVIQQEYGMDEVSERENFLIVYPAGIGNNWNVYDLDNNRDLVFAQEILSYMKANYRVKSQSVYSTGYSLGGFMSNLMACAFSTDFAGVAPLAGTFASGVMEDCSPQRPVPYMQIHGTRDFVIPLNGNGQWDSVDEALAFWANANGQQDTPVVTNVASDLQLFDFQPDSTVQHYRLIGATHGNTVPRFPKQLIIDFFKTHTDF